MRPSRKTFLPLPVLAAIAAIALPVAGCGREEADRSNGKALFVQGCGSCHVLERAGTAGETGPDLDEAFGPALRDGMDRDTVRGVVHAQILNPRMNSQMPPEIYKGDEARDVAAYVAFAAGRTGEDEGALAQAGLAGAEGGREIFLAAGCGSCHELADAGTSSDTGPSLDDLASAAGEREPGTSPEDYVRRSLLEPDAFTVEGFQSGVMPSYDGRLSDEQLDALVEYLLSGG